MNFLPSDFAVQVASSTSVTAGSISPVLATIVGVLLSAVVIEIIISAIRHK
jgi:hypothetical protein